MNKTKKVELLYKKAKGQAIYVTKEENRELSRYRVEANEGSFYTTKANISGYVTAVDNGCRTSFYDWCMNHNKADRRRKGSSEAAMQRSERELSLATMCIGWLTWGLALYWMFQGAVPVATCAVVGAVISVGICKLARRSAAVTLMILPIVLAVFFYGR